MVALGSFLALLSLLYFYFSYKKHYPLWLLKTFIFSIPLGFLALEAGWTVTEVGRQPWIVYNVIKTKDAITPMPGLEIHFVIFLLLYIVVGFSCLWLLRKLIKNYQGEVDVR